MPLQFPKITRRRLLTWACELAGGSALTGGAVTYYTFRIEPHWVSVDRRDLAIANLPAEWIGKNVVQISDLHVGPEVDSEYLISAMKRIGTLKPEMTLITGDFMTCSGAEQIDNVAKVVRHLDPGPRGCYAILGNHDYGFGWSQADVADKLVRRLEGFGIRTLRNECQDVAGLQIVGLDDLWSPNFAPSNVLTSVDWNAATLTLCHNPDAVDLSELAVCRGWILSGHTHGGQCKPPFLPPPILPVSNKRYTSGEFELRYNRRLYINRGLGHLKQVRFNVRPEITLFRLVDGSIAMGKHAS
jgi:predicted MPP superfamily phosphohydrolase